MAEYAWLEAHTSNFTRGRGGHKIEYIAIHYTATNASAHNNCKYFSRPNCNASAHYFIDGSGTIWQSVAETNTAWAVGNWVKNCQSISIEVVSAGQDFSTAEISELRQLTRYLMDKYRIPKERIIRHYDVTGKLCPAPYIDNTKWQKLRNQIADNNSYTEGWLKNDRGWWYQYSDGSYAKANWKKLDAWYYFDNDGYAVTGWQKINGTWYYFDENCRMQQGWITYKQNEYYLDESTGKDAGAMATGWKEFSDGWAFFDTNGALVKNSVIKTTGGYYPIGANGRLIYNIKQNENGALLLT